MLADGGEALIVVPNRRGLWCLSEGTPFGHGRPFSSTQLKQALRGNLFTPRRTARALFVPPSRSRLVLRTAMAWERIGLRWAKHFSGVLLMAAEKQIYAAPVEPVVKRRQAAGLCGGGAASGGGRTGIGAARRGCRVQPAAPAD